MDQVLATLQAPLWENQNVNSVALEVRHFLQRSCALDASKYQLEQLICRSAPYIESEVGFQVQALLVAFLYTYDRVDMKGMEERARQLDSVVGSMKQILRGVTADEQSFWYGGQLLERLYQLVHEDPLYVPFLLELETFFEATLVERENRASNKPPSAQRYFEEVRDQASAVGPCLLAATMFHPRRETLPDDFWASDLGEHIFLLGKRIVSVHNDIMGFQREKRDSDVNNYVATFIAAGQPEPLALVVSSDHVNSLYEAFLALRFTAIRAGLLAWWEVVHWFIVGNFEWSVINARRFDTSALMIEWPKVEHGLTWHSPTTDTRAA